MRTEETLQIKRLTEENERLKQELKQQEEYKSTD